ncbi:MAG TPA: AtpZ/AtpI family protein [Gemmatimonadales bacterium]|jgi:F0F1-type ATP synthase assembly protein I|nr:AtpZ/AtpI family protein [Gemmatimonadales bacterium]
MKQIGFLKLVAIWSLIPSYSLGGGLIGWGLDRWLHTFPIFTGAGLIIAFGLAIRDMLKLRDEIFEQKDSG